MASSDLNPAFQLFLSDFEKVLTQLHWPIISPPTQSLTPAANSQEISSQLDLLVTQLLALQTSYPSVIPLQRRTCFRSIGRCSRTAQIFFFLNSNLTFLFETYQ